MLIIREGNSHFVVSIEYLFKTREAAKVRCYELASFPLFSNIFLFQSGKVSASRLIRI